MSLTSAAPAGAPAVTIVLATYNRPDALRTAIRSVLRQRFPAWRLLVVGDHCAPPTGEVVRSVPDPRVTFVNLPFRFGEQAGPNSVGLALAETEYTALLNHDDAWLPDHLERALATLAATEADLFIGRAAIATKSADDGSGGRRPLFEMVTPFPGPPRHRLFDRHLVVCEPASACVFRTALARRAGPWRSHRQLHRAPLQDWLLRLWRLGAGFVYGEEITLLNLVTHYQHRLAEGCYAAPSPEHAWVDDLLERLPAEKVREALVEGSNGSLPVRRARKAIRSSHPLAKFLFQLVANRATAALYRRTVLDGLKQPEYSGGFTEVAKGFWMRRSDMDARKLVGYALRLNVGAVIRRLGYLLEVYGIDARDQIERLRSRLTASYQLLDPLLPPEGKFLARWRLRLNVSPEEIQAVART